MIDLYPNETLLYQWLLFMAALIILNWGVFRPVLRLLAERKRRTAGDEQRAAEFEAKIAGLAEQIEAKLQEARDEGHAVMQQLRSEAEKTAAQTMTLARQRMEAQLQEVRGELEQKGKEAELKLKQYARDLGRELGERILERPLT